VILFCTSRDDWDAIQGEDGEWHTRLEHIQSSLFVDDVSVLVLDDYNPVRLEEDLLTLSSSRPGASSSATAATATVVVGFWVYGRRNALWLRHLLRTSGMDRTVQRLCCPSASTDAAVYVGEGDGAICAGSTMAVAYAQQQQQQQQQQIPKDGPSHTPLPPPPPELQVHGLNLLGDHQHVSFGMTRDQLLRHPKTGPLLRGVGGGSDRDRIEICSPDQVYVWSQRRSGGGDGKSTTTTETTTTETTTMETHQFLMTPGRRGTIERYSTPDPIPPVVPDGDGDGGVPSPGEPSIDPSRAVQAVGGDSVWLEEDGGTDE
jgi:hypothetical protein